MLVVENVSHGFGARTILENVSFRLRKGEHIALVGANGEGKSTFLNIITKKLMPDAGNIKWSSRVSVGYLDQHTVLEKGKSIRDILKTAYDDLFDIEQEINDAYVKMCDCSEEEMNQLKVGHRIKAYGRVVDDSYLRCLVFMPDKIEIIPKEERQDTSDVKRVELHVHTKLSEMDADHITAWSKGGATDIKNCQMLCKTHNRAKGNK